MRRSRLAGALFPGDQDGIREGASLVDQAVNALHLRGDADDLRLLFRHRLPCFRRHNSHPVTTSSSPKWEDRLQASLFTQRS